MPKISVIMGAYNCSKTVEKAIDSILEQTYKDWEFIICDDGSTDNTWQVLKEKSAGHPNIVLLKNEINSGLAATLNRCIDIASGEFLARQDADDLSLPTRFEEQISYLEGNKGISVLGAYIGLFSDKQGRWGIIRLPESPRLSDWLMDTAVAHASVMMRRNDVVAAGKYNPSALRVEDYDLWSRMISKGYQIRTLPRMLYDVHWNFSDYRRKKIKYRFIEAKFKFHAYRRLKVPYYHYVFLLKIAISAVLPRLFLYYYHKIVYRDNTSKNTVPFFIRKASSAHAVLQSFQGHHSLALLLGVVFFSYSTFAALLFQKLLLPLFPSFHGGSGLLSADSSYFHTVAISLAETIKHNGWSSWSPYPAYGATGNVAILGALYAVFGYDPSLIIPLNAIIHATTGIVLFKIAQTLWEGEIGTYTGIITATLFVIFPSSLNWYAQVHRDGYAILGSALILYSLTRMLNSPNVKKELVTSVLLSACGTVVVAFVRPYNLKLLLIALACILIVLFVYVLYAKPARERGYLLLSVLATIVILGSGIILTDRTTDHIKETDVETFGYGDIAAVANKWSWHEARWMPDRAEKYFRNLAMVRVSNVYYSKNINAKSTIDADVMPDNTFSLITYLPRAFQVGLFAPFPVRWFESFSITRIVALAEMSVWYLLIPAVFLSLYYKRSIAVIASLFFAVFFLTVYGFALPNMGSLYRIRYLYLFIFIMTGISGYLTFLFKKWPLITAGERLRGPSEREEPLCVIDPVSVTGYSRVGIAGAGIIVTAATGLSFFGFFLRDILLARQFGLSNELDSFFVAMVLPMFFVSIFCIPLGTAVIPEFLNRKEKLTPQSAQRFLSNVSFLITAFSALLCVMLYVAAPYILPIIGWEFSQDKIQYSIKILILTLPLLLFSGSVIIGNTVLNSLGKYVYPSLTQSVVPVFAIGALLVAGHQAGIMAVAAGMVAGQLVNLIIIGLLLRKNGYSLTPSLVTDGNEGIKDFVRHYAPLMMAAFFAGVSLPVNSAMASSLSSGSVAAFNLGNKFILLVTGLIGTGIATVMLPYFSSYIAKNHLSEIRKELSFFLFIATILSIPISIVLYLTADRLIQTVFLGGAFGHDDVIAVGRVVKYGVIQLPFFTSNILIVRYLTAFKSNRIIMVISCVGLLLNVMLNIVLMPRMGVAGISLGGSISLMIATCILILMMRRLDHLMSIDMLILTLIWLLYFTAILCLHYLSYVGVIVSFIALVVLAVEHYKLISRNKGTPLVEHDLS